MSSSSFALETIHFGTCCVPVDASDTARFIAAFGNLPSWLFIANVAVGVFNKDIYFLFSSNFNLLVLAAALGFLSRAFAVPHPEGFDHERCHATHYAFPDAIYVSVLNYVICVAVGFYFDMRLRAYANPLYFSAFVFIVFFYCASTLVSHYFDAFLFVCNSVLALALSALIIFTYAVFAHDFLLLTARSTRKKAAAVGGFLSETGEVFVRNLPPTER